jgi:hypothetical protein
MNAKSHRNRQNQKNESRRLDRDLIEQRALQIARMDNRDTINDDDRQRAGDELLAPNETATEAPEISPDMEPEITAWDEAPASSGQRAPKVVPEDENSIGKDLIEKGLRSPRPVRQVRV